jgi:hypothetical protein
MNTKPVEAQVFITPPHPLKRSGHGVAPRRAANPSMHHTLPKRGRAIVRSNFVAMLMESVIDDQENLRRVPH